MHRYTRIQRWRQHALLLATLLLASLLVAGTFAQPAQAQNQPADLDVILWLAPADNRSSNVVEPGDLLLLDVRVENVGSGDAYDFDATVPYDRDRYLLTENPDANLSVSESTFSVRLDLLPPGEFRTIRVPLRIRNDVPVPDLLTLEADYSWNDARNGGDGISNTAEIYIDYVDDNGNNNGDDDGGTRVVIEEDARDTTPPNTCMLGIAREGDGYRVHWGGTDNQSGIRSYDVQVRRLPNGGWRRWQVATQDTTGWFGPTGGDSFAFRVRARDKQNNEEAWPLDPQVTTLQAPLDLQRCPNDENFDPV
jgi:hypothetical protein